MIGKTLGHYQISSQLGKGGMGEVYVADDLNLNRKVALKFLPEAFAGDPERMARFEREARLLASLNHPNIAAIYGLEQAEGKRFIVMELVEGETLQQRIAKGALPVEEALDICRQIAEGLEAAHEKGVIHRDLKPANVMITDGDKVKILDFGLAKALSDDAQAIDSSQSPTLTEAMTRPGVILGTAAYMSPEQAKGKSVDKRADIWAFGCILYECLTGKKLFEGETITETLAAILRGEPDWSLLPASTTPNIRFVLRRCLDRNMTSRFHCAGDLRMEMEEGRDIGETAVTDKKPWRWLTWAIVAALTVALCASIWAIWHAKPSASDLMRLHINLPEDFRLAAGSSFALSPDGRRLVFVAAGSDSVRRLWVRSMDSLEIRPINGTESTSLATPFWSPDGHFVAFDAGGKLKKIEVSGGPPTTICDLKGLALGGSWNSDGMIVFSDYLGSNGIMRVNAAGGTPFQVTKPNRLKQETYHLLPAFLPDGKHFIYLNYLIQEKRYLSIGSIDQKPEEQVSQQTLSATSGCVYVPPNGSELGQLLFLRNRTLMAHSFDGNRLEAIGDPIPIAENVSHYLYYGNFSASTNGVLIYRSSGDSGSELSWFDRQGKALGTVGNPGIYYRLAIAPKATQAAFGWINSQAASNVDVWLLDFVRDTKTRFTLGKGNSSRPIWSPDGNRVIFNSDREGVFDLYEKPASGTEEEVLLLKSSDHKIPTSWSSDGRFVMYTSQDSKTKNDLWMLTLGNGGKTTPVLRNEFSEGDSHFSPDMRWIAYVSDESGNNEIYVSGFSQPSGAASAKTDGHWMVSQGGGMGPRWREDSRELYYRTPDGKVMAVEIIDGKSFQAGLPKLLFKAPIEMQPVTGLAALALFPVWDATPAGDRFLISTPAADISSTPFTVILNWTSLLKK